MGSSSGFYSAGLNSFRRTPDDGTQGAKALRPRMMTPTGNSFDGLTSAESDDDEEIPLLVESDDDEEVPHEGVAQEDDGQHERSDAKAEEDRPLRGDTKTGSRRRREKLRKKTLMIFI